MYRFCPKCFRQPPAALPPLTIQTASLRGSTLRSEGGFDVRCVCGVAWHPCQHWHNTWGGLTSCLSLCLHFYFATPPKFLRPQIQGSTRSLFIFSFMCPCCLPPSLWLPHFGSSNHTHFQILSISTNVAHLSKG